MGVSPDAGAAPEGAALPHDCSGGPVAQSGQRSRLIICHEQYPNLSLSRAGWRIVLALRVSPTRGTRGRGRPSALSHAATTRRSRNTLVPRTLGAHATADVSVSRVVVTTRTAPGSLPSEGRARSHRYKRVLGSVPTTGYRMVTMVGKYLRTVGPPWNTPAAGCRSRQDDGAWRGVAGGAIVRSWPRRRARTTGT